MRKHLPMIGGVVLALVCAGGIIFFTLHPAPATQRESIPTPSLFGSKATELPVGERFTQAPISTNAPLPEGYKEYHNELLRFSFAYEKDATLRTYDEGNSAVSITVEDEKRGHALQIYVLPYKEKQIGQDRLLLDLPSGVRKNEETIVIDGVPAVAFISEVSMLGSTREVWLLHGGRLYEISVPLSMEGWLLQILPTFRFF